MKQTRSIISLLSVVILFALGLYVLRGDEASLPQAMVVKDQEQGAKRQEETIPITPSPVKVTLPQSHFVAQSFNNCGPASLSMVMSMFGKSVSQEELALEMRPFNNPLGGVDDKSIFASEFVATAKSYGFKSLHRPNGTLELLKRFTTNGVPVVVRTWLNPEEDIGHFRIVRGYDEQNQTILQDDSYQGPNISYSYDEFTKMWQPFNYGYILVYPKEKKEVVKAILGEEIDEKIAYENARDRAYDEQKKNPDDFYATFNLATAAYHLGEYQQAILSYEQIESELPARMLWYQPEPIEAYLKDKRYEKVFSLTFAILQSGNKAYTELYLMRGQAYLEQGRVDDARDEFEMAVLYNQKSQKAKDALSSVQ